ncbi:hypothetical protein MJC1_02715 [Methylocystis sp. MJC1]|nr:hypothetical protein MJC1_02715 [Methylocystis sp. MJC1]
MDAAALRKERVNEGGAPRFAIVMAGLVPAIHAVQLTEARGRVAEELGAPRKPAKAHPWRSHLQVDCAPRRGWPGQARP